jgi:hypothetical protein
MGQGDRFHVPVFLMILLKYMLSKQGWDKEPVPMSLGEGVISNESA